MRGAADVHALRAREEEDLPARLPEAVAPVRLLAEEEEVLVEQADLVDRAPADEHARAHDELGLAHLVVVEAARVEARSAPPCAARACAGRSTRSRAATASGTRGPTAAASRPGSAGAARRPPRRGRRSANATRRSSASADGATRPRSGAARTRPAVSADARVPARAEAAVLDSTSATSGKRSRTKATVPSRRAVVDDDRLRAGEALEALLDPRQRVVRDDDDRDVAVSHARPAAASRRGALPEHDRAPGSASDEGHEEVEEPGRERLRPRRRRGSRGS